jgi:hypothetical protein
MYPVSAANSTLLNAAFLHQTAAFQQRFGESGIESLSTHSTLIHRDEMDPSSDTNLLLLHLISKHFRLA